VHSLDLLQAVNPSCEGHWASHTDFPLILILYIHRCKIHNFEVLQNDVRCLHYASLHHNMLYIHWFFLYFVVAGDIYVIVIPVCEVNLFY